jgi:hypothetical protein
MRRKNRIPPEPVPLFAYSEPVRGEIEKLRQSEKRAQNASRLADLRAMLPEHAKGKRRAG